jgi:hypothetical protein
VDELESNPWYWQTRNHQNGHQAAWENPSGGLHIGCEVWEPMETCVGDDGEGPDFMFALKGKDDITAKLMR